MSATCMTVSKLLGQQHVIFFVSQIDKTLTNIFKLFYLSLSLATFPLYIDPHFASMLHTNTTALVYSLQGGKKKKKRRNGLIVWVTENRVFLEDE